MKTENINNRMVKIARALLTALCFFISATISLLAQESEMNCVPYSLPESDNQSSRVHCYYIHECDLGETRDGYLYDTTESVTWMRMKFQVVAEDDGSNPASTPEIVQAQMDQLNADMAPYGIQFIWNMRYVNASWARVYSSIGFWDQLGMRIEFFEDNDYQLNVVVTELTDPGYSGASNPQLFPPYSDSGGIVMSTNPMWNQFTSNLTRHTFTHEVGHVFGLLHTYVGYSEWINPGTNCTVPCAENLFTGSTDENGDFCSDTPPQLPWGGATFAGAGNDLCSGQPWPPLPNTNFMNVANTTKDDFSPMQVARMKCYAENHMNLWIAGVRIKSDIRYGQAPLTVQFIGEEHDSVGSWLWEFGDDSTSSMQNPEHVYNKPGVYTVQLTGSGDSLYNAVNNSFVAVHSDTIAVVRAESMQSDTVSMAIFARNYLLVSTFNIPISYANLFDAQLIVIATDGLRTSAGTATIVHHDSTAMQSYIEISAGDSYFDADSGVIVNLKFLVPFGGLDSALIEIADYSGYSMEIDTYYGSHDPVSINNNYLVRNSCCIGVRGDLNGDGNDGNILDLNYAVNYVFRGNVNLGNCDIENDVNNDGSLVNILDLNYLVNRVFRGGPEPADCP